MWTFAQPSRSRHRDALVSALLLIAAQVALSVLLLVGTGLFGRTLTKLHAIEIGFNRDGVLLFTVRPSTVGDKGPERTRVFEDLRVRVGALPGVIDASLSSRPMPMGGGTMAPFPIDGLTLPAQRDRPPARTSAVLASVGPGFFKTLQMRLSSGRALSATEAAGSPKVIVVNHAFARTFGIDNPAAQLSHLVSRVCRVADPLEMALDELGTEDVVQGQRGGRRRALIVSVRSRFASPLFQRPPQ